MGGLTRRLVARLVEYLDLKRVRQQAVDYNLAICHLVLHVLIDFDGIFEGGCAAKLLFDPLRDPFPLHCHPPSDDSSRPLHVT